MIEQLRMRGLFAHPPKVVRGRGQTTPGEMLPDAIGHHPGGQWVVGAGDLARQLEPAAAAAGEGAASKHFRETPRHWARRTTVIGPRKERRIVAVTIVADARSARRLRNLRLELAKLRHELRR